jgi:hypothetical protein
MPVGILEHIAGDPVPLTNKNILAKAAENLYSLGLGHV